MNFRIFQESAPEIPVPSTGNRLQSHIERALELGQGGASAWSALDIEYNLTMVEAELAALSVDCQKLAQEADRLHAQQVHPNDIHHALSVERHGIQQRLELHAWRRCLHLSQRFVAAHAKNRAPHELVDRFIQAVLLMRRLFASHEFGEGNISLNGMLITQQTAEQIIQVFAWQRRDAASSAEQHAPPQQASG